LGSSPKLISIHLVIEGLLLRSRDRYQTTVFPLTSRPSGPAALLCSSSTHTQHFFFVLVWSQDEHRTQDASSLIGGTAEAPQGPRHQEVVGGSGPPRQGSSKGRLAKFKSNAAAVGLPGARLIAAAPLSARCGIKKSWGAPGHHAKAAPRGALPRPR